MSKITNLIAGLKNFTFASKVKLTPCLGNLNVPRLYSTEPVAPEKDASILKGDMPLPQLDLPPQVQRYTGKVNLADLPEENVHLLTVHSSLNNTILTLCNQENKVILVTSCGTAGFKKARRSGYEPAYQAAIKLIEKSQAKNFKVSVVSIKFKGFGPGREAVFRAIRANSDWGIRRLIDCTPIPHNGCRPPKPRRL
ncbi:hypothetical protein DSO57_1024734 [Entomophthora muscae]|uniref:Uncharacterized protein n=1 Tax=Entomophthora muscae TaxID=34485 RepID=A0ACC2UCH0_9FUNG|nr:hypothetical protein DSO57_1024734 [Entomophthora muscae]